MLLLPQAQEALAVNVGDSLGIHEHMRCLCDSFISACAIYPVANQISPFNTTRSGSSLTVNDSDSVLSSKMEAVRTECSKGIFSLGRFLGNSDFLFQFVTHHKLVPAFRKWPKCASEITINNYHLRCDRQRIRGAATVNYSLPNSRTASLYPNNLCGPVGKEGFFGWDKVGEMQEKK